MQQEICPHMKYVYPTNDEKFQNKAFEKSLTKMAFKCTVCYTVSQNVWICLHENCGFYGCGQFPKGQLQHIYNHYEDFKMENSAEELHCIFINPFTTQIICIECDVEIFDFEQYGLTGNEKIVEQWCNPRRIRDLFADPDLKNRDNLLVKTQITNPKSHWKSNKGLCGLFNQGNTNFMNCIFQVLAATPSLKKFYLKIYDTYNESGNFTENVPKSFSKKISYYFSQVVKTIWSGQVRAYKPQELVYLIYENNENFRGYGFKDPYELFKFLLNCFHDEYKILVDRQMEIGRGSIIINDFPQEEWQMIYDIRNYTDTSLISDTYKGKLCARVKCLNCANISIIEEDFMGISLNIPEPEPNKLNEWGIKYESENFKSRKDGTWKWISSFLSSDITKVTLYECFIYFCETESTSPQKNFFCDKCKTNVFTEKTYAFLTFPNVLCLHFQRFKAELAEKDRTYIDFPLDNLDLSFFLKKAANYDQSTGLFEFLGLVEQINDNGRERFRCILKFPKNRGYYLFDDVSVTRVDEKFVREREAYILFYKQKINTEEKIRHNVKSQIKLIKENEYKLSDDSFFYVPGFWYEKLLTLRNPGMIHSSHLLCYHGLLKPDYYDCFPLKNQLSAPKSTMSNIVMTNETSFIEQSVMYDYNINEIECDTKIAIQSLLNQSVTIPREIMAYLREKFGGGPFIKDLTICQNCLYMARNVRRRKKLERTLIAKYDNRISDTFFVINELWMSQWKDYLYSNKKFLKKNFIKGLPIPSPIDNKILLLDEENDHNTHEDVPIPNLKKGVSYRTVNIYIWKIFEKLYGGGPMIARSENTIYGKSVTPAQYELPKSDQELLEEMLMLVDEKRAMEGAKIIAKELREPGNNNDEEEEIKVQVEDISLEKQNQG